MTAETAIYLIIVVFAGWAVASYVTSFVYRLPRNEPLFERTPFCSSCGDPLQTRDLFPMFSWLLNKGRCRFCKARIPPAYLLVEFATPAIFVLTYLEFGISEQFLLVSIACTGLIVLAAIYFNSRVFCDRVLITILLIGALYRTLHDGTIYGFIIGGFLALVVGLMLRQVHYIFNREVGHMPAYVKLAVMAGVWCV